MPVFGFGLATRFTNCGRCRFRLAQVTFLNAEIFLLLDQCLKNLEIRDF